MILLDTHALVWWLNDPARLPARVRRAISNRPAPGSLGVSAISLFEIATLVRRGRIQLRSNLEAWLENLTLLAEVRVIPVTAGIAVRAGTLTDTLPGDPADRIIIATALDEQLGLVTGDARLRQAGLVEVIW
ncbi:MAG: type II toxin-antitoxin system VapC family toxin [Chromatiales bacterium]|nr:type II toxin-antitoxin system VapC family toxin [Chromatiales bacterium]